MLGMLAAVKSGAGLAPLPMLLGGSEDDLEAVLSAGPEISTKVYLVMHADLRSTPRVRAFCDFIAAEISRFSRLLTGQSRDVHQGQRSAASAGRARRQRTSKSRTTTRGRPSGRLLRFRRNLACATSSSPATACLLTAQCRRWGAAGTRRGADAELLAAAQAGPERGSGRPDRLDDS